MKNGRYSLAADNESSDARDPGERRRIYWGSSASQGLAQTHRTGRSPWRGARLSKAEKAGVLGMVAVVVLIIGLVITAGKSSESGRSNPASEASKVKWALELEDSPENVMPLVRPSGAGAGREKKVDVLFGGKFNEHKPMVEGQRAKPDPGRGKKPPATKKDAKKTLRTYTVKKGDMLGTISRRFLGTCTRWKEIEKLNPKIDPNNLKPGTPIKIPAR